jgi:hypothetical protein
MTTDQYTELIAVLAQKFGGIDQRFEEAKREREEIREEARRHATVLFEQSQANLRVIAEGLGMRLERVESGVVRLTDRVGSLEDTVGALGRTVGTLEGTVGALGETVRLGFADHERRIQVLEGGA